MPLFHSYLLCSVLVILQYNWEPPQCSWVCYSDTQKWAHLNTTQQWRTLRQRYTCCWAVCLPCWQANQQHAVCWCDVCFRSTQTPGGVNTVLFSLHHVNIYTHQYSINELFMILGQVGHTRPKFLQPVDDLSILSRRGRSLRSKVHHTTGCPHTDAYLYLRINQLMFQEFIITRVSLKNKEKQQFAKTIRNVEVFVNNFTKVSRIHRQASRKV